MGESVILPLVVKHVAPVMAFGGADPSEARGIVSSVRLTAAQLAKDLVACRMYAEPQPVTDRCACSIAVDARFLLFEFLLGFVLRPRQYELVTTLVSRSVRMHFPGCALSIRCCLLPCSAKAGDSSVQQMIMGQGESFRPLLCILRFRQCCHPGQARRQSLHPF